ncbi:MAG: DUF2804 family protein [Acidimicrobiales bacterium]
MYRGDGTGRPTHLALPPGRMPLSHRRRPLKRWRYVGAYGEALMLCVGEVRVAGIPQVFWAVWDRTRRELRDRTVVLRTGAVHVGTDGVRVRDGAVAIDLTLTPAGETVEVVSPHGRAYIWTRKWPVSVRGAVTIDGHRRAVDAAGLVDESAGYHERRTAWEWAAGVGRSGDGHALVWNLVSGVHDAEVGSERTVWVDGVPTEVGPATFGPALESVTYAEGGLRFVEEAVRRRRDRLVLISSDYVQPFGTFSGDVLPGVAVTEGFGVMERHRATW